MKKLILLLIFSFGLSYGQEKKVFDTITYNELIDYYNQKMKLQNESLEKNIERCKIQLANSEKADNSEAVLMYKIVLKGLINAQNASDKNQPFITIYKDDNYTFYDAENKFVGRIYPEKFKESKDTDYLLKEYFYLMQE